VRASPDLRGLADPGLRVGSGRIRGLRWHLTDTPAGDRRRRQRTTEVVSLLQVNVRRERERWRMMPEPPLHLDHVPPGGEQPRGARVTERVAPIAHAHCQWFRHQTALAKTSALLESP
jgi:hypothetical protein